MSEKGTPLRDGEKPSHSTTERTTTERTTERPSQGGNRPAPAQPAKPAKE